MPGEFSGETGRYKLLAATTRCSHGILVPISKFTVLQNLHFSLVQQVPSAVLPLLALFYPKD